MANTYFQFKKFIVHQEHTAMKVCTDACLFGAWVANDVDKQKFENILDIGTGTGLLSLMIAQALESNIPKTQITAVEIESGAAKEAESNFTLSPWASNLQIVHSSVQAYSNQIKQAENVEKYLYDCIITNPPFFEGDLQSPNINVSLASHSTALPWKVLIQEVENMLKINGIFYVLIPALRAYTMQKLAAQKGLQLIEEVVVYNAAKQKPFRAFQKFIKTAATINEIKRSNLIIKDAENKYTKEFINLLSPYYLHL